MADAFGEDLFNVFDEDNSSSRPIPELESSSLKTDDREIDPTKRDDTQRADDLLKSIVGKRQAEQLEDEDQQTKKTKTDGTGRLEVMQRIQVHTVETVEACLHEVAIPPETEFVPLQTVSTEPAKTYPFILDPFQKEALLCLENNQSVLVSAHTSAGKTVVAVYAIAMSLRDKQRVIYTTPIKALSNQKYRELFEEFQDVGLMTGDVTINPTANLEEHALPRLRNHAGKRGVVWEETIILLPDNVHYVFLSATIPNARQFAEWICYLHDQPCHVVYTDYRPTPLQHYLFPSGGDGIHLVVDENGEFREENFNTAMSVLKDAGDAGKGDQRGRKGGFKQQESNCYKIVKMILERKFAPVIVFSFSKKDCEAYAMQMTKLDFNTDEEKNLVQEVFNNAIDALSDEDKKLPQVEHVLPLLKKGIGIHHGGLLPLLKETIEILFSEGLIKALFATETFAMGLNMPARTVLFTNARKFDGQDFRWGAADSLNSAFHLTYNMVLNLLRVEEINPEFMLERSFYQFQNYAAIPGLIDKMKNTEDRYNQCVVPNEDQVSTYYKIRQQLNHLGRELLTYIQKPQYILPFLQPGRLVHVKNGEDDFGWTMVVNFQKKANQSKTSDEGPVYVCEVLANLTKDSARSRNSALIKPQQPPSTLGEMQVIPVMLHLIHEISAVRLYLPKDLRPLDNRQSVGKSIQEVQKRFPDGLPLLDPVEDMGIKEKSMKDVVKKIEAFEHRLFSHPLSKDPNLEEWFDLYDKKVKIGNEVKSIKAELKKKKSLLQMDELKCRKRVLRRLGYCTASDVIELKGRVACEISSGDELMITELLFNGVFNDLTPQQSCALLSCFVFQENAGDGNMKLTEQLAGPLRLLQDTARRIARVSKEAKLEIDEENYVGSFKPEMMDIVHAWCNGSSFFEICKMTNIFEGSIIRCMRRLEETLRQMVQAAKAIGNTELENKFNEGIRSMKRDIVFAASLYL
ncbi:MTREX-like protein [Mya arenaria]|uniref:MTREX-like protein n=1 Tax=Mya arenaria TaxID=6604 RepID=A0ABY7FPZ9_MYAAR|nr:MTREX-like protein [Mya arenaria]